MMAEWDMLKNKKTKKIKKNLLVGQMMSMLIVIIKEKANNPAKCPSKIYLQLKAAYLAIKEGFSGVHPKAVK